MMTLTQVYSFWRHVTNLERQESKEYLDVLYKLLLRPIMARSEGGAERAN
jgi:sucrose synthase